MKKLLCILLALGLVISAGRAYAHGTEATDQFKVKTHVFVKDEHNSLGGTVSGSPYPQADLVPLSTIGTNDWILGLTLTSNTPDKGALCAIYDLAAPTATSDAAIDDLAEQLTANSNLITEIEVGADPGSTTLWFPYPKRLTYQLMIMIGQAHAAVTVYYIDVSDPN